MNEKMKKAMLVIDMPNCCKQCPLLSLPHSLSFDVCKATTNIVKDVYGEKPEWCPLCEVETFGEVE